MTEAGQNIEIALRAAKLMHTLGGLIEARDYLVRRAIFAEGIEQLTELGKAIDQTRPPRPEGRKP